jgi:hypothetical protein
MRSRVALLLGLWLGASSCRSRLQSAVRAYDEARYPDAVESLRGSVDPEDVRYALYRGLSELAVGNARSADRWLRRAWQAADLDPEVLSEEELGRLVAAWRSMGRMPAER